MRNSITRLFNIAILVLCIFASESLVAEELLVGQAIRWKELPGASGYNLEIEDGQGATLINRRVTGNSMDLSLPVGRYRFRITAYNKFKKVGRIYDWQELIIKSLEAPIVRESPAIFNPGDNSQPFVAKGDYLHRGTRVVFTDSDGKTYTAKTEVLPDGSGIRVLPPPDLPDGDYKVTYKNSRGKPYKDVIVVDSSVATVVSSPEQKNRVYKEKLPDYKSRAIYDAPITREDGRGAGDRKDRVSESGLDPVPISGVLWRQVLVPGWGNHYSQEEYTGAFYFVGTVALIGIAANSSAHYVAKRRNYDAKASGNFMTAMLLETDPRYEIFNQMDLQNSFQQAEKAKIRATNAWGGVGAFYLLSVLHVVLKNTYFSAGISPSSELFILESFPEVWGTQIGTRYNASFKMDF